jgi:DNA-binding transcriptional LysR family regulator
MLSNQVYYFLILYEERNFTRASRRCGVSQPSLTNGIKNLEKRFGGRLFDRVRSSLSRARPTQLAEALKPHLERMADSAEQAQRIAEQVRVKPNDRRKKFYPSDGKPMLVLADS